jgi:predicted aminopeptidase
MSSLCARLAALLARLVVVIVGAAAAAIALVPLSGCASLEYLAQAGAGQDDLLSRSRPIDELLRDGRLTPRVRRLVAEIDVLKRYGEHHGLRPTPNYRTYARLDRPAAVWVVSACEPLRFRSKRWTFPIVGSFTYLGWFHLDAARRAAAELTAEGWDADVRPAGAYSTAGYFDDPLLSTMITRGADARGDLANTVFHESMHATFFVPGQSRLNESVANFVGDSLAERYMKDVVGPDAEETRAYLASEARAAKREERMRVAYEELEALYASARSDADKLAEKARVLRRLERELGTSRRLGNASLVQFKTYHSGEDELRALLAACGGDVERLVRALDAFQNREGRFSSDQADPAQLLAPLVAQGCATTTPG